MEIGMLWFDNDKQVDLLTKVKRAAKYYEEKYGRTPNICFVHPTMVLNDGQDATQTSTNSTKIIELRTSKLVLPNHFWIGINSQLPHKGQNVRLPGDHPQSKDLSPALNQAGLT